MSGRLCVCRHVMQQVSRYVAFVAETQSDAHTVSEKWQTWPDIYNTDRRVCTLDDSLVSVDAWGRMTRLT